MSRQEHNCQHGVGHSDGVHGCDGCCSKYFGCVTCGNEQGKPGEYNYCHRCESYKYFDWITIDE